MPYILELRDVDGISNEHQFILSLEYDSEKKSLMRGLIKIAEALYGTSGNKPDDLDEKIKEIEEAHSLNEDCIEALKSITISPNRFYINSKYSFYSLTEISEEEYKVYFKNKEKLHLL